jgi:hypothetical protein
MAAPYRPAENLQAISKEIQGGLQLGFKPVTSSAAKHQATLRVVGSQLTHIR